ncbi:MAG TPA: ABC transporter permease [Candidatus Acidoferrum sp.]|nr:ABC transporter permease [Candidatus Acidoferrum sp.]
MESLGTVWQDIRYAVRMLAKKPGFTAIALLSLTLGIGGNTTIFTLVKAVFLQPIPVKDPSTVISVFSTQTTAGGNVISYLANAYPNAMDYREKNDVFSGLALYLDTGADLDISGNKVGVDVQLANWDFFDILGVRPAIGRFFLPDEDQTPGARPVVILSNAIWVSRFGADPGIAGKNILLDGQSYSVVGVTPKEFHDAGQIGSPDMWAPMMMHEQLVVDQRKDWFKSRRPREVNLVGRLKPGVTLARATVAMQGFAQQLQKEYPTDNTGRTVVMLPLSETNVPPQQRGLFTLAGALMMGIVGLVLLIACGNVANLLLARAMQRRRELAIRLSLGASRGRLIRQLLTENLLLGVAAGGLGIVCAFWARGLVWKLLPGGPPPNLDFSLDWRVLLFTMALAVAATILFGLLPSLQASNPNQMTALRDRTDAPSGTGRWYGLRGVLVMAQIAFSLIALVGSALFLHSLRNAQQTDPGFEVKHELIVLLSPASQHYPQARGEEFYREAVENVRALPMVADAGVANSQPFGVGLGYTSFPEDVDSSDPRNGTPFPVIAVAPGYFRAAGISLLRGRDIEEHDDEKVDHVVVINQALAGQLWKGKDPIGKRLSFSAQPWKATVIGVVSTAKINTLGEAPQPALYFALKQLYYPNAFIYVRTKGDPAAALPSVRSTIQKMDPAMTLGLGHTVSSDIDRVLAAPKFAAELLAGFGALALLLAAIGTYGVMSYSVSQRTQEIGIRMALGAQRGNVLRLILSNGMAMVVAGIAIGLGASVFFTRSVRTLLYGIGSFDAVSFLAAAGVLMLVALLACWIPARRAMGVDPIIALRYE